MINWTSYLFKKPLRSVEVLESWSCMYTWSCLEKAILLHLKQSRPFSTTVSLMNYFPLSVYLKYVVILTEYKNPG